MLNQIQNLFITSNIYLSFSPKTYVLLFVIKNTAYKQFIKHQRSNRRTHSYHRKDSYLKYFSTNLIKMIGCDSFYISEV